MFQWLDPKVRTPFSVLPRPILYIEDNISDIFKFLEAMAGKGNRGDVLEACTIMVLAKGGDDTTRDIIHLLCKYSKLQIVALTEKGRVAPALRAVCLALRRKAALPFGDIAATLVANAKEFGEKAAWTVGQRYDDLEDLVKYEESAFVSSVSRLIRPGGMVVCDLDLGQLQFNRTGVLSADLLIGAIAAGKACQPEEKSESIQIESEESPPNKKPPPPKQQNPQLGVFSGMEEFLSVGKTLRRRRVTIGDDAVFQKNIELHDAAEAICLLVRTRFPWRMTVKRAHVVGELPTNPEKHRVGFEDIPFLDWALDLILWPCIANGRATGRGITGGEWNFAEVPAAALTQLVKGHLQPQREAVLMTDIKTKQQSVNNVILNIRQRMSDQLIPGGSDGQYQLNTKKSVAMVSLVEVKS